MTNNNMIKKPDQGELVDSIVKSDSKELVADIAEFTIDQLLDDSFLKEIPVVEWVVKAKSIYHSMSDRILLAKLVRLLLSLSGMTKEEKENWERKNIKNEKDKKRIGEKLLLLVDKYTDLEKAEILGEVFKACIRGALNSQDVFDIGDAVEKCRLNDLRMLKDAKEEREISLGELVPAGLAVMQTNFSTGTTLDQINIDIPLHLTKTGSLLRKILRKEI